MKVIARKIWVLLALIFFGQAHAQSWPQPTPPNPATQSQSLAYCNELRAWRMAGGWVESSCFLVSMNSGSVYQPISATYTPGSFGYLTREYYSNGAPNGEEGPAAFSLSSPKNTSPGKNLGGSPGCNCGGEGGGKAPIMVNDPINVSTGNSYVEEGDFESGNWLVLRRFYNSQPNIVGATLGALWRNSFDRKLYFFGSPISTIALLRPDGTEEIFTKANGVWSAQADNPDTLTEVDSSGGVATGYQLFVASLRHVETYNTNGLLLTATDETGQGIALSYGGAPNYLLSSVTDASGRQLIFTYDSGPNLTKVTLPDGGSLIYGHDAQTSNLTSVTYPDGKVKTYVYNESSLTGGTNIPYALTGIIDETGTRYESTSYIGSATYAGYATASYLAGNVDATQITYNSDGSATVQYPLGLSSTLGITAVQGVNKVASVSISCGPSCNQPYNVRTYDTNGYPAAVTDWNGDVTKTTYDINGLLSVQVDAFGSAAQRTTTTTWNIALRVPLTRAVSDSHGTMLSQEAWVYNATGQVLADCNIDPAVSAATSYTCAVSGTPPAGVRRDTYTYCSAVDGAQCPLVGLTLSRTDALGHTMAYAYYLTAGAVNCGTPGATCNRPGDLKTITDAMGHVTTIASYDGAGRATRMVDSNGVISDLTYTPRGWLAIRTVRANINGSASGNDAITTIGYTAYGAVASITDPDGVVISYTYDAAHRLTDIADAVGNHIHYTLDAAGNKTKEDTYDSGNTLRRTLSRSYNTLGQLTGVTDGLNHTVFNAGYTDSYDANGNLVHTADGLGIQRKQGYDALNRLVSTLDNYNGTDTATQNTQATFAYDALDNLEGVTDPDGLSTTYDYDGLSNPKALHSPDTGTTSFQVDAAGNRIQQTDAKGIVRTTTYDAINRPVTVSYPDNTQNIAYHYDEADSVTGCSGSFPMGRLTRIVETAVTTTYCYDNHGNVTKKTQAQGTQVDTTSYSYTAAGRLSGITTPSQTVTQYSRDGAGRISGVAVTPSGGASQTVVSAVSYLPFGPISSYTLGNGQTITRSYDANYQLTDLTSLALNLHFARDVMGNIIALGNTSGANPAIETYGYDPLYRLTGIDDASGNAIEAYTYSKTGDRLSKTKLGGLATGNYGYDPNTHHMTSIGSAARTYDANGNTTGSASAGEAIGYGYNVRDRMSIVQRNQATVANYTYNALNERVAKATTSPQTLNERFVYDEMSRLVGEYGSTNRDYIWLDGLPIAVADSGSAGAINYVYADGNGSPRVIATGAGDTVWQWSFQANPFGEQSPVGGYVYNLRSPGQYYDAESGLYHNVNRDFEAATGRYVESDPIGLNGGMSTYAYVANNPYGDIDPLGLACNANGCWNTAAEAGYAKAGNYSVYYQAACQGGDLYACRAGEVAADRDIPDDWLRDFLTHQTNRNLEHSLHEHRPPYMQCDQIEPYIQRQFENIRRGLAKARYQQLLGATPDHPRMVSRSSIADFHHAVFEAYGSDAGTFGGDKWDSMDGPKWSARIGHGYDWCASPACH
jgi:RHS repeat-associated protein